MKEFRSGLESSLEINSKSVDVLSSCVKYSVNRGT